MKELLELESPSNLAFERRSWRIERAGWLAIALLLAAAFAGLLGPGPLSIAELRSADGSLAVSYPRFMRLRATSRVQIRAVAPPGSETKLFLDAAWVDRVRLLGIAPAPARSELDADGWKLVFSTPAAASRPLEVSIDVEPRSWGRLAGRVGLGSAELRFQQLVYP